MSETALNEIHDHMIHAIRNGGGRIDALYYCAINDDKHHDRKPNTGMLLEAARMFPEIEFARSVMVGDKAGDMQLGRNAGTYTVLISASETNDGDVDKQFDSLQDFAKIF